MSAGALREALLAAAVELETLVALSQRQIAAILEVDGRSDALAELGRDIRARTIAVATQMARAKTAAEAIAPADLPAPRTLRAIVASRPAAERATLEDPLSAVRSLAQALSELQAVSLLHAQRGLQMISAWRALATGAPEPTPAYGPSGRAATRQSARAAAFALEVDL